jgi:hypothetical protein
VRPFRRLAELARTLRAAHDEGNALIRDLIDATVSSISATQNSRADTCPSHQPLPLAPAA